MVTNLLSYLKHTKNIQVQPWKGCIGSVPN